MTKLYDGSTQNAGDFAEYLVACDLIGKGYRIHMASPGSFYDIIVDINGKLYRLQVKSSYKPKKYNSYKFNVKARSSHANYDLIAYVAINIKEVIYELPKDVNQRHISKVCFLSRELTFEKALEELHRKQDFED